MKPKPKSQPQKPKPKIKLNQIFIGGVSQKTILYFTQNLSIMLKTGSTLNEALETLEEQSKGQFKKILNEINTKVNQGLMLSEILSKYPKVFSSIYINIVKIGEESGTLDKNLLYLYKQLDKSYQLKKKIISAMIYPMIILAGSFVVGTIVTVFVLPKLSKMFTNLKVELPFTTKMLIALSNFLENHGVLAASLLLAFIILIIWLKKVKKLRPITHKLLLQIPLLSQFSRNLNLAMFYRNLSLLLQSGVTIDESLRICSQTVSNVHYQKIIASIHSQIKSGESIYILLKRNQRYFPLTDLQIINVGEESGTLAESLGFTADIREDSLNDLSKNLSTAIEPILFIILGLIVAILALAIITPLYSMTQDF